MLDPSQECVSLPARLIRHGKKRKLELPLEGSDTVADSDPVLLKVLAQAQAAQRMLVDGADEPSVSH